MCSVLVFFQGGLLSLGVRLVWIEASIAMSLYPSWALGPAPSHTDIPDKGIRRTCSCLTQTHIPWPASSLHGQHSASSLVWVFSSSHTHMSLCHIPDPCARGWKHLTPILTPHIPLPPGFYPAGFCRGGVWEHVNTCAAPDQSQLSLSPRSAC